MNELEVVLKPRQRLDMTLDKIEYRKAELKRAGKESEIATDPMILELTALAEKLRPEAIKEQKEIDGING